MNDTIFISLQYKDILENIVRFTCFQILWTLYMLSNSESLSSLSESFFYLTVYNEFPWETHTHSFCTASSSHEGQFEQNPKYHEVGTVSSWRVKTGGVATCFLSRCLDIGRSQSSRRRGGMSGPRHQTCSSQRRFQCPRQREQLARDLQSVL